MSGWYSLGRIQARELEVGYVWQRDERAGGLEP